MAVKYHLPDIVVVSPIFVDEKLMAFVSNLAHPADFMDSGQAHIFQEGVRILPIRIFEEDKLQKDVFGGYGKPQERPPYLIERDLREGKISVHTARKIYGFKT